MIRILRLKSIWDIITQNDFSDNNDYLLHWEKKRNNQEIRITCVGDRVPNSVAVLLGGKNSSKHGGNMAAEDEAN